MPSSDNACLRTDSFGRQVVVRDVLRVMTSNIGEDKITHWATFDIQNLGENVTHKERVTSLEQELGDLVRP